MRPWEETWTARDRDDDGDDFKIIRGGNWNDEVVEGLMMPEDAKLAAAAPEMARLLLHAYTEHDCVACHHIESDRPPHAEDCTLVGALGKAGVLP